MSQTRAILFLIGLFGVASAACSSPSSEPVRAEAPLPPQAAADITGTSDKLTVTGRIEPIAVDAVDGLGMEGGRLVVRGTTRSITVDVPGHADPEKPTRHWALTTEGAGDGNVRRFTFVHGESLDDFSIELPPGDAPLRFGVLTGREGGDVMIFAWGAASRSYWGYVTITRKQE